MPYSDYRPDLMGYAALTPSGSFEAGSMQSFTLVYTAGAFGVDDTGSIKIGFRFATDFGPVQFTDPKGPGYTTVEASNGATLEAKWEFKRNIRPWSRSLYIGVVKDFLAPGDTITIRFGDRRQGSPGIRLQTYCESAFEFRVFADPIATYDYVALPESPKIAIVPGPGVRWHAVLPTMVRTGEPFRLRIKADDKWGNPSNLMDHTLRLAADGPAVAGLPETIRFAPGAFAAVADNLRVGEAGDVVMRVLDESGRQIARANPLRVVAGDTPLVHFWGDTHGQSNETLGTNDARAYFGFGRDKAFLDVMGHQGNDFQITGAFWRELNELAREFDKPGRFVCIPGYEWSANTAVGGDRNVHYRHEGETIHRSSHAQIADATDIADEKADAHTAHELFRKLKGKDCVVVAHVGGRYADIKLAHDPMETAVEVHSAWGTFEWIVRDAFEKGYRVGIVANSDGHKGRPGACYPGASFFGSQGGLTCFLAEKLDRDAIFECMRRRRHYATTGNRALLGVSVTTARPAEVFLRDPAAGETKSEAAQRLLMGDIARVSDDEVDFAVEVVGSAPIERLDIYDGLDLLETVRPYAAGDLGRRVRLVYSGAEYRGRARTTTWDGSLKVEGNRIVRTAVINNWNLDRGIQKQDEASVAWKAVTTGNYGGIDLWLDQPATGHVSFQTRLVSGRAAVAELGHEPRAFEAGGLERRIELQRLPEAIRETRIALTRRVKLRASGDTRLYVRVQQEDGHRMWSSPIYLFRG
ncbi:MAG TPA: DUF3604 domain-containing protein [Hyphomicrobiaceae bacterium]|nr:DUF3604 domain-containing protein [Hyphomicrobiaceae bacterium]